MQTIYDNKHFKIERAENGGYWIDNKLTGRSTHATVYGSGTRYPCFISPR